MTIDPFNHCLQVVQRAAEPLGYRRLQSRFNRNAGEAATEVWYQRSRSSSRDHIRFTVNLSITLLPLLSPGLLGRARRKIGQDPHWTERLGFLMPVNRDMWWEVTLGNASEIGALHARLFEEVIHPELEARSSVAWHVSEWRAGRARWATETQWHDFLSRAEDLGY